MGRIIPNIWKNKKCSKPPTRLVIKVKPVKCSANAWKCWTVEIVIIPTVGQQSHAWTHCLFWGFQWQLQLLQLLRLLLNISQFHHLPKESYCISGWFTSPNLRPSQLFGGCKNLPISQVFPGFFSHAATSLHPSQGHWEPAPVQQRY